jgi:hypothetical protein
MVQVSEIYKHCTDGNVKSSVLGKVFCAYGQAALFQHMFLARFSETSAIQTMRTTHEGGTTLTSQNENNTEQRESVHSQAHFSANDDM